MDIDVDVIKWLAHINRKRKNNYNEDNLLKELTSNSIDALLKAIKKQKLTN